MSPEDPVREFLEERGSPEHMVAAGLEGLVDYWEVIVGDIEEGYALGLDDYLNDMDARELLEGAMAAAPLAQRAAVAARVKAADQRLRDIVVPAGRCLWGDDLAEEEGWSAEKNWWYYTRPREPGPSLADDLEGSP